MSTTLSLSAALAARTSLIEAAADGTPLDAAALAAADRALAEAHARAEVADVADRRATRRAHEAEVEAWHREAAEHDAGIVAGGADVLRLADELDAAKAAVIALADRFGDAVSELRQRHHSGAQFNWHLQHEAAARNPVLAEIRAGKNSGTTPVARRARTIGAFKLPEIATINSAGPEIAKDSRSFAQIARTVI